MLFILSGNDNCGIIVYTRISQLNFNIQEIN